ncbi:hypothetical protein GCM10027093_35340 [Paraburkholderia jirisanensis]
MLTTSNTFYSSNRDTDELTSSRDTPVSRAAGTTPTANSDAVWAQSGDTIRGAVEYDEGHDRHDLEAPQAALNEAQQRRDDARRDFESARGSGGAKKALAAIYNDAKSKCEQAQRNFDAALKTWNGTSARHLAATAPYAGNNVQLDADNRVPRAQGAGSADWVYSATDAKRILQNAVENAKASDETTLSEAWGQQVEDLRKWRNDNAEQAGAEDIKRNLNQDAYVYLKLQENAKRRSATMDAVLKGFEEHLDANEIAVNAQFAGNRQPDRQEVVRLMQQRQTELTRCLAEINDQSHLFSALANKSVNNMRVALPPTADTVFKPEDRLGAGKAEGAETQASIDSEAAGIQRGARLAAQAEHAADNSELPTVNNRREKETATYIELAESAHSVQGTLGALAHRVETEGRAVEWSIPGMKLLDLKSLVQSAQGAETGMREYVAKAQQGTLTAADKKAFAGHVLDLAAVLTPYIPVIGPYVEPFVVLADTVMSLINDETSTPVEEIASQLNAQTAYNLSGQYAAVSKPAAR